MKHYPHKDVPRLTDFFKGTLVFFMVFCSIITSTATLKLNRAVINGKDQKLAGSYKISTVENRAVLMFSNDLSTPKSYTISENGTLLYESPYPIAQFYNLKGGKHLVEIQHKYRPEIKATITLEVTLSIWQQWWFWPSIITYVALLAAVGFYIFYLYDFKQKTKLQNVRNQIAADLHDEVGSNLNAIAVYAELLRNKTNDAAEIRPLLDNITNNTEESVNLIKDTIWALNPLNDSWPKLSEKMKSFGTGLLTAKGIRFTYHDTVLSNEKLNLEQKRNIYLIFKEAINNIAKHSMATEAICTVTDDDEGLSMKIQDNGVGFNMEEVYEGNGLKNIKTRGIDEDIKVVINSKKGNGTEILVTFE